ncbi:LCP family protein [Streptomyces sp. 6N223]|uniref:LCP family protein n=1 Tax=Streptomyces sp. 6N223 TaxID=3457412 RepID=UPI003FD652D1
MNDRQDPYGQNAPIYGYDEYGRPIYQQPQPQQPQPAAYDGYDHGTGAGAGATYDYGTAGGQQTYDYGTGQQPPVYDGYDPYGQGTAQQPAVADPPAPAPAAEPPSVPGQRRTSDGPEQEQQAAYQTEQFAFVDEQDEESEDVIDWLKFTESRTERREEAKRRGRVRRRLLVFTLVLAVLGGAGFLWATDRLPAIPGLEGTEEAAAPGAQVRDVIVVHLRETNGDTTSTALLVANETTERGTTLLLPNELAVTSDGATTTLGQAVVDSSAGEVRDAVGGLLGADIKGTWRLDTPYLENLVNIVGGITLDTNAEVAAPEDEEAGGDGPLVPQGQDVLLDGEAATAYAVHRAEGEPETAQLERFGQVMAAVFAEFPTGRDPAIEVVRALLLIPDPSLPEEELGASLAQLAALAQAGDGGGTGYGTSLLPVQDDGTLSEETADGMVKDVLGGTVSNPDPGGAVRIGIRDASGAEGAAQDARIDLVNGGFTVVDARAAEETQAASQVTYADEAHRETALDAARTLGLPEDAVTQGEGAGNADVTILLGEDYAE